jgi:hypothetical protein
VAVAVGVRVDTEAKELVLRILRHDARVADTKKLDAFALLVGIIKGQYGFSTAMVGFIAVFEKSRNGASMTLTMTSLVLSSHRRCG